MCSYKSTVKNRRRERERAAARAARREAESRDKPPLARATRRGVAIFMAGVCVDACLEKNSKNVFRYQRAFVVSANEIILRQVSSYIPPRIQSIGALRHGHYK